MAEMCLRWSGFIKCKINFFRLLTLFHTFLLSHFQDTSFIQRLLNGAQKDPFVEVTALKNINPKVILFLKHIIKFSFFLALAFPNHILSLILSTNMLLFINHDLFEFIVALYGYMLFVMVNHNLLWILILNHNAFEILSSNVSENDRSPPTADSFLPPVYNFNKWRALKQIINRSIG